MSFSQKTKNELARIVPPNKCCGIAELAALISMDGTILLSADKHLSLSLQTRNAAVARKVYLLGKTLFNLKGEVSAQRSKRFKKNNIYKVIILSETGNQNIFEELGVELTPKGYAIKWNKDQIKRMCCQKSFLRGAFLGGGSITDPENRTYHLEIVANNEYDTRFLVEIMNNFNISPKITNRKKDRLIYLKDSEMIVNFLNVIGAHTALLNFESIKVRKDVRNRVNRLVNCETANLNKTIEAGFKQVEAIRYIDRKIGLDNLPLSLRQLALARLENPEVSLKELGELMSPPLSKSGVNHRMRRLKKIADKLRGKKGDKTKGS